MVQAASGGGAAALAAAGAAAATHDTSARTMTAAIADDFTGPL
jgi:hypothetical protein